MQTNTHHSQAGLKFSAFLPTTSSHEPVSLTNSPLVCQYTQQLRDGSQQGFVESAANCAATAFARWLCPSPDSMEAHKAQYCRWNPSTGQVEAAIYPEFAADVLRKLYRLKPSHLEFHTVSL